MAYLQKPFVKKLLSITIAASCSFSVGVASAAGEPEIDSSSRIVDFDPSVFHPDPYHEDREYSVEEQLRIYGDKRANYNPRPLLEVGRPIYDVGLFKEASYALGEKNPINSQFVVYGDWRTAMAYNDNGAAESGQLATRLNLDFDYKFTGTERIHVIMTPLEDSGRFSRYQFSGDGASTGQLESDFSLDALFFEGDLGAIVSGLTDEYTKWDMPIAFGLMPLQFQNGIWLDDAFTGVAATIPAQNSAALNISNMDVTFFAGFDEANTALRDANGLATDGNDINLYGIAAFIEANEGYWELDYGYTDGRNDFDDQDYHNVSVAFTSRYAGLLSNSIRVISNFGQDRDAGATQTADGTLLLIENSWITDSPTTFVPYFNFFAGFDKPQAFARANAAGGVLKNTGILFETDGLTGFPTLDADANNTAGLAVGVQNLFSLDQQLVVEVAAVQVMGDDANSTALGDQWGIGVRYQKPISREWIVRADAMYGERDNQEDVAGIRFEIRRKF